MVGESVENSVEVTKIIPWKNPGTYILLVSAVLIYWFLLKPMEDQITPNIIERNLLTKLLAICVFLGLVLCILATGSPRLKGKNLLLRSGIFFSGALIFFICITPLWGFFRYDNEKIISYAALTPSKARFTYTKNTVYYPDIKSVQYESGGGDSGNSLNLNLTNGKQMGIPIGNISYRSIYPFLDILYSNCEWLRQDIECRYGSIADRYDILEKKNFSFNPDGIYFVLSALALWLSMLEIIFIIKRFLYNDYEKIRDKIKTS